MPSHEFWNLSIHNRETQKVVEWGKNVIKMMCKKISNRTFLVVANLALEPTAENNSSKIT